MYNGRNTFAFNPNFVDIFFSQWGLKNEENIASSYKQLFLNLNEILGT